MAPSLTVGAVTRTRTGDNRESTPTGADRPGRSRGQTPEEDPRPARHRFSDRRRRRVDRDAGPGIRRSARETFTWALVLAVFFLVPYGLIFAETGGAFTGEGGVYVWCRKAFGRPVAAIASLLTWVTQPVWVGGSMAFIASETWSTYVTPFEHGLGDRLRLQAGVHLVHCAGRDHQPAARQVDPQRRRDSQDRVPGDLPGDDRDLCRAPRRRGPVGRRFQPDGGRFARRRHRCCCSPTWASNPATARPAR